MKDAQCSEAETLLGHKRSIDVTGKTVFAAKETPSGTSHRLSANVSSFSNGLYLLKVSDGENSEWKKFVW